MIKNERIKRVFICGFNLYLILLSLETLLENKYKLKVEIIFLK